MQRLAEEEAEEAEQQRLAEEAEQKQLAEEAEQKRLAEEAEQQRLAEEAEQQRLAAEAEKQKVAEEQGEEEGSRKAAEREEKEARRAAAAGAARDRARPEAERKARAEAVDAPARADDGRPSLARAPGSLESKSSFSSVASSSPSVGRAQSTRARVAQVLKKVLPSFRPVTDDDLGDAAARNALVAEVLGAGAACSAERCRAARRLLDVFEADLEPRAAPEATRAAAKVQWVLAREAAALGAAEMSFAAPRWTLELWPSWKLLLRSSASIGDADALWKIWERRCHWRSDLDGAVLSAMASDCHPDDAVAASLLRWRLMLSAGARELHGAAVDEILAGLGACGLAPPARGKAAAEGDDRSAAAAEAALLRADLVSLVCTSAVPKERFINTALLAALARQALSPGNGAAQALCGRKLLCETGRHWAMLLAREGAMVAATRMLEEAPALVSRALIDEDVAEHILLAELPREGLPGASLLLVPEEGLAVQWGAGGVLYNEESAAAWRQLGDAAVRRLESL